MSQRIQLDEKASYNCWPHSESISSLSFGDFHLEVREPFTSQFNTSVNSLSRHKSVQKKEKKDCQSLKNHPLTRNLRSPSTDSPHCYHWRENKLAQSVSNCQLIARNIFSAPISIFSIRKDRVCNKSCTGQKA